MESEAKPTIWLVRISAEPGILNDLAAHLSALDAGIVEKDGVQYLTSPQFDALAEGRAVLDLANEILAVVDGMLSMTTGGPGHLKVQTVYRADDEGRPFTQYVFPQGIPSSSRFGIPTIHSQGDPPPQREDHPFHRILDLAQSDPRVKKVLRLIGSRELDWVTLYRIYEVIEKDVGDVSSKGWVSKNSLSLFRQTANDPIVSGDDARHGELSTLPPSKPLELERAKEMVRHIVDKWLKEKTKRPGV